MNTLTGTHILLRALEPTDLDFLYLLENDESVWEISNTTAPYSKYVLKQYLDNAHKDIYEAKQLRLVICTRDQQRPIGFVDLFEFDPKHRRVGIGIVIFAEEDRGKGYAREALELVCRYAFTRMEVHQIFANITADNSRSIQLFEHLGFRQAGVKKDWIISGPGFKDEILYQLFA